MKTWRFIGILSILTNIVVFGYFWAEKKRMQKHLHAIVSEKEELKYQINESRKTIEELMRSKNEISDESQLSFSESLSFAGVDFDTYTFCIKDTLQLTMHYKNKSGELIGDFEKLQHSIESEKGKLHFATNGGIFRVDHSPLGLYVEKGKKVKSLNRSKGAGNFFLKPNGVFYVAEDEVGVVESSVFNQRSMPVEYATQSGPMLLIDGAIHPEFNEGSLNKKLRSGVGMMDDSTVVFVISKAPVNFYDFATFFRDSLYCDNALYLDGVISKMYLPELNRFDKGKGYSTFIAVSDKP